MFLEMFSRWQSTAGKLAHEDPRILLRIIKLSSIKGGISQRVLRQELNINQSRLSKLTKKLASNSWVELQKSPADRRVVLTVATAQAKDKANCLRTELAAIVMMHTRAAPKKRKIIKVVSREESLL
jgi:DNA-binding MarR family transcriptional regulator